MAFVDLCFDHNGEKHHTDDYDGNFVVRRGDSFCFKIQNADNFYFELRGTGITTKIEEKAQKDDEFSFQIISKTGDCTEVSVFVPVTALVSSYKLVLVKGGSEEECPNTLYILFNPWNKDDEVYMEDEKLKEEYVLNESGIVFVWNYKALPWNHAQFSDAALKATFKLLESEANTESRDAAYKVVRHMSAMSSGKYDSLIGNNGILVGKWATKEDMKSPEGPYPGGKQPTDWTGSEAICKEFLKTGEPVKYGQCWVFSGLYTTMMRCLGIPCRSVTNYRSCVDKDGDCVSKMIRDSKSWTPIMDESDAFIWNFHVWNDAWVSRPDLPAGFGGWQGVDGCPQMLSNGLYRCGPASLRAIKEGTVEKDANNDKFDTRFLFASVNADKVTYEKDRDTGKVTFYENEEDMIGWYMGTKLPGDTTGQWNDCMGDYKYAEYTMEERAALMKAMRTVDTDYYNKDVIKKQNKYVEFGTKISNHVHYGEKINVEVTAEKAIKDFKVNVSVVPYVISYSGVVLKDLEKLTETKTVKKDTNESFKFELDVNEILGTDFKNEEVSVKFMVWASVDENGKSGQYFTKDHVCEIERKVAELKVEFVDNPEGKVKSEGTFKLKITFPKVEGITEFTNSSMTVDTVLQEDWMKEFELCDDYVNSGSTERSFKIKKMKKDKTTPFTLTFSSNEISCIHGSVNVTALK